LKLGKNTLGAVLHDRRGASITITNHPLGGPVFAGPQLDPWTCEAGATDAQCDKAPVDSYLYEKKGATTLSPYNPNDPPSKRRHDDDRYGRHRPVHRPGGDLLRGS
jgi:hypothetical protein